MGGFSTLVEGLEFAARTSSGFVFHTPRGAVEGFLSYAELRDRAEETAGRLAAAGLKRGDRVAIVAETAPSFMVAFFGCQYAGMLPCPMPYPMHIGGKAAYIERIAAMMRAADAAAALGPAELSDHLRQAAARAGVPLVLSHDELAALTPAAGAVRPFAPHEAAYIQYSSGSTSDPKGVLISQRAICANTTGILRHGLKVRPEDRAFSWLPLYHDMGLVGFCLAPMMGQVPVHYLATPAFARRPALWLKLMSEWRCTIAYAPSFGYELAARRINGQARELDLSAWRIAGIGGDMVRADVLTFFAERLAVAGFDPRAFLPSYGMAEMSLAISFHTPGEPLHVDTIDRAAARLSQQAVPVEAADSPRARTFVSCGRVLPGHELKVVDSEGKALPERHIGHIWVKGPSMMDGYYRNPEATAAVMRPDGFMDTGDMGYLLDGEIYITGRAKDLILYHGRNIWPQDIEWAAEQVSPLKSGDVAAFAVEDADGSERVVVLAECRLRDPEARADLRRRISAAVHQAAGIECDIVLVPPHSLPYTSSGKLARARARAMYLAGEIRPLCDAADEDCTEGAAAVAGGR
jgi:fatty-acyl-CoA synthase